MQQSDRRQFLKLAGLAGVTFTAGLFPKGPADAQAADFHFVQMSDTHWGFKGPPNPDAEHTLEMTNVCDQQPVQTFGSNGLNEPFRDSVRLRGLNWRTNDSDALGMRRGIKAVREFAIVVSNQKMNALRLLGERPSNLSRLLRDPLAVGMRRAAGQMHAPTADFNEEQHVQSLQPHCVDGKEVHCHCT